MKSLTDRQSSALLMILSRATGDPGTAFNR